MNKLYLQIITPEKTLLDKEVSSVTCHTESGQITILPGHIPMVTNLIPGELVVKIDNEKEILHVGGGVMQVKAKNQIVILSDAAEHIKDIDIKLSKEAIERAKEKLEDTQLSDREVASITAKMERDFARLHIARKHAHKGHSPITSEGVLEE